MKTQAEHRTGLNCRHILLLAFIFTVLLDVPARSQEYSYRHYNIFDGLIQNQVTCMYQDTKGFMWIGTKGGVSRFDGKTFKNYTKRDGLPAGSICGFFELRNKFYCHALRGISVLEGETFRQLCAFENFDLQKCQFSEDSSSLYYNYQNQIYRADAHGSHLVPHQPKNAGNLSYFMLTNHDSTLVCLTTTGLYILDKIHDPVKVTDLDFYLAAKVNSCIYLLAPSGKIMSNGRSGIYRLKGNQVTRIFNGDQYAMRDPGLLSDGKRLLFATSNKAWVEIDTLGHITDQDSIPGIMTSCVLRDKEGMLWFGDEAGLYNTLSFSFRNYGSRFGLPEYVWSIFETADSSICFAGYLGGLCTLKNGHVSQIKLAECMQKKDRFYMGGLCNSRRQSMIPVDNGKILFIDKGIQSTLSLKFDKDTPTPLAIYEDVQRNKYYFGINKGVVVYDISTKLLSHKLINGRMILDIEKDKYGRLWLCTGKGIYLMRDTALVNFEKNELRPGISATSCTRDSKGNMWLADKYGLYLYTYQHLYQISDLPFSFVINYKRDHLVAGSVTGFFYFDLNRFYALNPSCYRFFDRFNGFTGIECGQNGSSVDSHGNVWIPTSDRVVQFMPYKLDINAREPSIAFYSLETSGHDLKWSAMPHTQGAADKLEVNWDQNNIRICFQGISLRCPEKVKYKTRLTGYDDTWTAVNSQTTVTYTNLNPGHYVFEVMACNGDGIWTSKAAAITFVILPAFWQTLIFKLTMILLFALIIAGSVFIYMRYKRNRERRQRQVEEELIAMQISTINAQVDPHFIFNAITAIGTDIQENNTDQAYLYFVKVSNLLRSSIINTGQITRTLKEELDFVDNYLVLQKYRFGKRFDFTITLGKDIDLKKQVPKMCIQVFAENGVKHGLEHLETGGHLDIAVNRRDGFLIAEITDNGIGRTRSKEYASRSTGVGLEVFHNYFNLLNKMNKEPAGFIIEDLFDKNGQACGTRVTLKLPDQYKYPGENKQNLKS